MGLRYPDQRYGTCFFVTSTFGTWRKLGAVDGFFAAMADSIDFSAAKYDARIAGYALMPSHIHLLVFVSGERLSSFMRDFKKYVAQKVTKDLGIRGSRIWMRGYDRVQVESEQVFRTKLDYIHQNPVTGGLVNQAEKWAWSSARDYLRCEAGPVNVWKGWG